MFLNYLNDEQKDLFIELAIKAAESNGIVALEQKNMLKCFAIEMNMKPVYQTNRDVETIIDDVIKKTSEKELKVILFEILGIIISDNVFDEKERYFTKHIVERCNIDLKIVDKMVSLLEDYSRIYKEIIETVL